MFADTNRAGVTDYPEEDFGQEEQKSWESIATYFLEGIFTPLVSCAGLLGNLICILILSRKKGELGLKPSFTDLLIFLAVSDSLFLIFANLVYTSASHLSDEQYQPLLRATPVLVPLIHISLTASVYTTLAVAVERTVTFAPSIDKDGPSTLK